MRVAVKLFAAARQLAGRDEAIVELPSKATVADLRTALAQEHPSLAALLRHALFALDAPTPLIDSVLKRNPPLNAVNAFGQTPSKPHDETSLLYTKIENCIFVRSVA